MLPYLVAAIIVIGLPTVYVAVHCREYRDRSYSGAAIDIRLCKHPRILARSLLRMSQELGPIQGGQRKALHLGRSGTRSLGLEYPRYCTAGSGPSMRRNRSMDSSMRSVDTNKDKRSPADCAKRGELISHVSEAPGYLTHALTALVYAHPGRMKVQAASVPARRKIVAQRLAARWLPTCAWRATARRMTAAGKDGNTR
jgi:hypothetical protein